MSKSKLSRRALVVTSAAALPALALPFTDNLAIASNSDAELIALGPELEIVVRDWLSQLKIDREKTAMIDVETEKLTGVKLKDAPHDDYRDQYWTTREAVIDRFPDQGDEDNPWNEIHSRAFPLARRILSLAATTTAGLAIQARAASLENIELWDDGNELDAQEFAAKGFIESVCGFLGIVPVAKELALGSRGVS